MSERFRENVNACGRLLRQYLGLMALSLIDNKTNLIKSDASNHQLTVSLDEIIAQELEFRTLHPISNMTINQQPTTGLDLCDTQDLWYLRITTLGVDDIINFIDNASASDSN